MERPGLPLRAVLLAAAALFLASGLWAHGVADQIEPAMFESGLRTVVPEFSAADVMLGSSAGFLRMFGMLPESRVLEAYGDRCMARPAFQKAQAAEPT